MLIVPLTLRLRVAILCSALITFLAVTQHSTYLQHQFYARNRHLLATSMELRLDEIACTIIAAHLIHSKV